VGTRETESSEGHQEAPTEGLWRFFEHPITLAALAILLGVLGLFIYTPILSACGGLFLIAFYRSKAVAKRSWRVQALAYTVLVCIIVPALYFTNRLVERKMAHSEVAVSPKRTEAVASPPVPLVSNPTAPPVTSPSPTVVHSTPAVLVYPGFKEKLDMVSLSIGSNHVSYPVEYNTQAPCQCIQVRRR